MPGTLHQHQTSDELLSATSDAMVRDSSSSSTSGNPLHAAAAEHTAHGSDHSGITFNDETSGNALHHAAADHTADNTGLTFGDDASSSHSAAQASSNRGISTVRHGKMLDSQPRARSSPHHHLSTGR